FYSFLPFMILPIYASLEKLDFRLVEAGYDLYASRFQVLTRIIIPLTWPGIVTGCVLVFIPSFGAYVTPLLLGGGRHLMIGDLIALQFGTSRNWPLGSAFSMILMAFVMIALYFQLRKTSGEVSHG
ncbi:MAG: ABC transporter permease, partial [Ensifer adhaerens]